MSNNSQIDSFGDEDLGATAERLREASIEPTPLELDRALVTARRRSVRAPNRHTTGGFMRSKVAIVAILAMGFVTSGAGATLAFQGSSGSGSASTAEYPPPNVTPGQGENGNGDTTGNGTTPGGQETLSNTGTSGTGSDPSQSARQTTATSDGGKLPFTGLAAIPVILLGLGLLTAGIVLQRRTSRDL
jgi:hypothetical protein